MPLNGCTQLYVNYISIKRKGRVGKGRDRERRGRKQEERKKEKEEEREKTLFKKGFSLFSNTKISFV